MKATYIILRPVTPKGKFIVCKLAVGGGEYSSLCECRSELTANMVLDALNCTLYTRGEKMYKAGEPS